MKTEKHVSIIAITDLDLLVFCCMAYCKQLLFFKNKMAKIKILILIFLKNVVILSVTILSKSCCTTRVPGLGCSAIMTVQV